MKLTDHTQEGQAATACQVAVEAFQQVCQWDGHCCLANRDAGAVAAHENNYYHLELPLESADAAAVKKVNHSDVLPMCSNYVILQDCEYPMYWQHQLDYLHHHYHY